MGKATFTEESILRQLDGHAAAFTFPVLETACVQLGDVRPSAYRDRSRWSILRALP